MKLEDLKNLEKLEKNRVGWQIGRDGDELIAEIWSIKLEKEYEDGYLICEYYPLIGNFEDLEDTKLAVELRKAFPGLMRVARAYIESEAARICKLETDAPWPQTGEKFKEIYRNRAKNKLEKILNGRTSLRCL